MIVDLTRSGYQKGYQPKDGFAHYRSYFATATAAFRKEALVAVNGFDLRCKTGEDVDLSIRLADAGYELWFEPTARIVHHHRRTLPGLLKQWFGYGFGHGLLFRKHSHKRRLYLCGYRQPRTGDTSLKIARLLNVPFPVPALIFISSFHVMGAMTLAALVALGLGSRTGGAVFGGLALAAAVAYFGRVFSVRRPLRTTALAGIRWLVDTCYVGGGILGGLRHGVVLIEPARVSRPVAAASARTATGPKA